RGAERIGRRVAENVVEKRLPLRKIRIEQQRQAQPVLTGDKGRVGMAGGVEPVVALGRAGGGPRDAGGVEPGPRHRRLAMRRVEAAAKVVVAPAEEPDMPIRPLPQSWAAIHSSVS